MREVQRRAPLPDEARGQGPGRGRGRGRGGLRPLRPCCQRRGRAPVCASARRPSARPVRLSRRRGSRAGGGPGQGRGRRKASTGAELGRGWGAVTRVLCGLFFCFCSIFRKSFRRCQPRVTKSGGASHRPLRDARPAEASARRRWARQGPSACRAENPRRRARSGARAGTFRPSQAREFSQAPPPRLARRGLPGGGPGPGDLREADPKVRGPARCRTSLRAVTGIAPETRRFEGIGAMGKTRRSPCKRAQRLLGQALRVRLKAPTNRPAGPFRFWSIGREGRFPRQDPSILLARILKTLGSLPPRGFKRPLRT